MNKWIKILFLTVINIVLLLAVVFIMGAIIFSLYLIAAIAESTVGTGPLLFGLLAVSIIVWAFLNAYEHSKHW